jgi:uncharacterized LabA/DUF88 family protein
VPINVYIDGFNLYYGAVRGTPYKWLDLHALCVALLPGQIINRIRYFTARPKGLPHNPDVGNRHEIYLRALRTIPDLYITLGRFADREVVLPQFPLAWHNRADPTINPPLMVKVWKSEEKRSDVNLATYLLLDCFNNEFDQAIVVSNDSDLAEPIKVVTQNFSKRVMVINPQRSSNITWELKQVATSFMPKINSRHLASSQFPATLVDSNGTFYKPPSW